MLESINMTGELSYKKLTEEERESRGILGRLIGKIADWKNATRNGRKYSEKVWEQVFNSPLMKEKIKNHVCYGELGHPMDGRTEIDPEKVAVCLAEVPKKGDDGFLYGVFDILSTPNGRILKALCDYGSVVGVSSRGTGDIITDYDGNESVDPETYDCECFDVVLIPAVEQARLKYVTESVGNKSLSTALTEALNKSSDDEKKIMEETLNNLGIHFSDKDSESVDINANQSDMAAEDDGADVVKELQEALKDNKVLEAKVASLQEKLSVCYAKEAERDDLEEKFKVTCQKLSFAQKSVDALKKRISSLHESFISNKKEMNAKELAVSTLNEKLQEQNKSQVKLNKDLSEDLKNSKSENTKLLEQVKLLTEKIESTERENNSKISLLQEQLEDMERDTKIKSQEYSNKLDRADTLVERYKAVAKTAVNKYIESQALKIGVSEEEILNKLPKGYTFNDIDSICESLQQYQVNIKKLPFDADSIRNRKIKVSVSESSTMQEMSNGDDIVDDDLRALANNI